MPTGKIVFAALLLIFACLAGPLVEAQTCDQTHLPLIDVTTCQGGSSNFVKGDAVINPSVTVSPSTTITLNNTGVSFSTSLDNGKPIAISNMGYPSSAAAASVVVNCNSTGELLNGTYYIRVAQYAESSASMPTVTAESYANLTPTSVTVNCTSPNAGQTVINPPTPLSPTPAGWNVYMGTAAGQETMQALVGSSFRPLPPTGANSCSGTISGSGYGCPITSAITINQLQVNGPAPLRVSALSAPGFQSTSPLSFIANGATGCTATTGSVANGTYYVRLAFTSEANTGPMNILSDVSRSGAEKSLVVSGGPGCLVIKSPSASLGNGWIAYAAGPTTTQAMEIYQPSAQSGAPNAVCSSYSPLGTSCANTATLTLYSITSSGPAPVQQFTTFQTVLTSIGSGTTATFRDPILNSGSGPTGVATWGTDNGAIFNAAVGNSCPQFTAVQKANKGCVIIFPGAVTSGSTVTSNGRYFTTTPLNVGSFGNLVLAGGFNSGGAATDVTGFLAPAGGASVGGGSAAGPRASAEVVCAGRTYCVTIGDLSLTSNPSPVNGLEIRNLGFEDVSEANGPNTGGNAFGGLRLVNVNNFLIERSASTNFSNGYCFALEGFGSQGGNTQVGTIFDSAGAGCLRGLNLSQGVSGINITNGNFQGNGVGSLAMDQGSIGANVGTAPGVAVASGSIRIDGTQFRDFFTHVRFFDCGNCTAWDTKHENVSFQPAGTTVYLIDGDGAVTCTLNGVGFAAMASMPSGFGVVINHSGSVPPAPPCTKSFVLYPMVPASLISSSGFAMLTNYGDSSANILTSETGLTVGGTSSAISNVGLPQLLSGSSVPPAGNCAKGSLFLNTAGGASTTLYVCESGTGWAAK